MGNSSSSGKPQNDETVDFGYLIPQGVYTGPRDWNQSIVTQLICARRLAPFYRPLEDYNDDWDDDHILAARKGLPDADNSNGEQSTRSEAAVNGSKLTHGKRPSMLKEPSKPEAQVYRGAVECPICFLYYPPNINHSRCCGQAICTECFVQIKRIDPTTTHLVSEPAACPYCVQDNFGVVYTPPPWRAGIGSEGSNSPWLDSPKGSQFPIDPPSTPTHKRRQKSYSADSPEVVTTDHIRPDWEAKLAAVQAAVTRRANRRIIMRQVGDRLIPVGVTSGRVHALSPEEAAAEAGEGSSGSRRSRRRQQAPANPGFEQFIGLGGQDLEELMVMEAMRLSLLEHEEQQRKEAEEKKKAEVGPSTSGPLAAPVSSSSRNSLQAQLAPSRSRTPSPAQSTSDNSSDWLRRASNPPPFSTLSAALAAATTASAVIAPSRISPQSGNVTSPPTITVEETSETPMLPSHQDSQASSTDSRADPTSLYSQLPSSLESAHQPLISPDVTNGHSETETQSSAPRGEPGSG